MDKYSNELESLDRELDRYQKKIEKITPKMDEHTGFPRVPCGPVGL